MPFRRRRRRQTIGKNSIKHSGTLVDSIGPSTAPVSIAAILSGAGGRSTDGSPVDVGQAGNTASNCSQGNMVKFVNFRIQAGISASGETEGSKGWLEWAVVFEEEKVTSVPITNLGNQTLGDVCTQMFRNDCLATGAIPIADSSPETNVQDIQIKLARRMCKIKAGTVVQMFMFYRDTDVTETGTDEIRLVSSFNYKEYI